MTSIRTPIADRFELAAANDVDGDPTNADTYLDVTGASRVMIVQVQDGTAGTVGIDVIQGSRDGGSNWLALTAANFPGAGLVDDAGGTAVTGAILNAAGVEPTGCAYFSAGPFDGPMLIRCVRAVGDDAGAVLWTTGAPSVDAFRIG